MGTVKLVAYGFVPQGYATCDGQSLAISSHTALFSLLGVSFGGNGTTEFRLPDLSGRVPIHVGPKNPLGHVGGQRNVTLNIGTMPSHQHPVMASSAEATSSTPANTLLAAGAPRGAAIYRPLGGGTKVNQEEHVLAETGGGQPHDNMQPYNTLHYVIALEGTYPSRSSGIAPLEEEDYIGDVRPMAYGFAPRNWAQCNGQLLPIQQYQSLFALIGTTYGGNGQTSFALPDLRGRVALSQGQREGENYKLGARAGHEEVALETSQIPPHNHQTELAMGAATTTDPQGNMLASEAAAFNSGTKDENMNAVSVGAPPGAGVAHNNMMPFETVNYCICLQGLFPSRN
ncbi:phage tail protein [Actibacterium sp. XHP0104]|uniref:phage tail protein n=1 Tax=Actibacterium sp. XHP0104 TaxID=2984335 RepID=UPI0021E7C424|nr:tail fiber protein [Actibacterium sp. XHP0104]MCV2882445.1 tail fiber protein [Actibacterium sp. XHP0104]